MYSFSDASCDTPPLLWKWLMGRSWLFFLVSSHTLTYMNACPLLHTCLLPAHTPTFTNTDLCTNPHADGQCISTCKHTHPHTHTQLIKLTCWLRSCEALCSMRVNEETRAHKVHTYKVHMWTGWDKVNLEGPVFVLTLHQFTGSVWPNATHGKFSATSVVKVWLGSDTKSAWSGLEKDPGLALLFCNAIQHNQRSSFIFGAAWLRR